jgi:hypothetical protein
LLDWTKRLEHVVILGRPKEAEGSQPIAATKQTPQARKQKTIVILSEAKDLSSKQPKKQNAAETNAHAN